MPNFEVRYAFTCRKCGKANKGTSQVTAPSKQKALEHFYDHAACDQCSAAPESDQTMTIGAKALD